MSTVKLFVEGGGVSKSLRTECRAAFSSFLQKSGLSGFMPRIVASGSRNEAYSDYCTALKNGENAVLLIDSETEVIAPKDTVFVSLSAATRGTKKGSYDKGNHSFGILGIVDPNRVCSQSPWAKRFVTQLSEKMHDAKS